jgi:hypothetical protein
MATATDADGGSLDYQFDVYKGFAASPSTLAVALPATPTSKTQVNGVKAGAPAAWRVSGKLADGDYEYRVKAWDGTVWSKPSALVRFVVDTHAPSPPALTATGSITNRSAHPSSAPAGSVGVTTETVTIKPRAATDDAYGYAYAIAPTNASITWPSTLVCNVSVNGYTTVCPSKTNAAGGVNQTATVAFTMPDDTATFSAETFDAAGNVNSARATIRFAANGDYTNVPAGHSWATDTYKAPPSGAGAACPAPQPPIGVSVTPSVPLPDSATKNALPITSLSGGVCWISDSTAPPHGGGVLLFDGTANTVRTGGPAIDTSKSFTVGAWLNPAQASNTYVGTALAQQGVHEDTFLLQNSADTWRLCVPTSDGSAFAGTCVSTRTGSVSPHTWVFVAGIWDAQDHELLLYVTTTAKIPIPVVASQAGVATSAGPIVIGSDTIGGTSRYWAGRISDPFVIQGVADARQLGQLASRTVPHKLTPSA